MMQEQIMKRLAELKEEALKYKNRYEKLREYIIDAIKSDILPNLNENWLKKEIFKEL